MSWFPRSELSESDARMTADRREQKFLLAGDQPNVLSRTIAAHLPKHFGPGMTRLPGAQQFATTIYFDTASRHLFSQASEQDDSVKLRAREYYLVDPSMISIAKSPRQLVRFEPVLWFELKHKSGHQVRKQRFGVPKHSVEEFLSDGRITEEMVEVQADGHGPKSKQALEQIAGLCRHYGEPFVVDCLVNYRRAAWQDEEGTLRLTLDRQVAFFRPPADIWTRKFALIRETLGPPSGAPARAILEVKSRTGLPPWLERCLADLGAEPASFSKFVSASRAVHT